MDATQAATLTFGARHFGQADRGNQRRNRRLVELADDVTGHPGGTLPDKLRQPKDLKGCSRLLNQPRVTHASILAPHQHETGERMWAHDGVVLVLHDTTTLDYSTLTSLAPHLGQIGDVRERGAPQLPDGRGSSHRLRPPFHRLSIFIEKFIIRS
jgi:hypothetical protein